MLVHKHLIIRAEINKPFQASDVDFITKTWFPNLVSDIGMKILMGPYAVYSEMVGNRGLTAFAIIETSHIALHMWDEDSPALMQLDVYTCSALDPVIITNALRYFDPVLVEMKYLDREHGLTEIPIPVDDDIVSTGV